jgi:hypothetical protein
MYNVFETGEVFKKNKELAELLKVAHEEVGYPYRVDDCDHSDYDQDAEPRTEFGHYNTIESIDYYCGGCGTLMDTTNLLGEDI